MAEVVMSGRAEELRCGLVAELRGMGAVSSGPVGQALLAVSRHEFMPEATLEQAYAVEFALITNRDPQGAAVSSVSAARIQAFMLEQAGIEPGMRVLEIGSGVI